MADHQDRVREERRELNTKVEKLERFVASEKFMAVATEDRDLLCEQLRVMRHYLKILDERIERF